MIACISPLEYNISETINTINYASRARRIKNAVSKNQSEVGWDDMDYLRNMVLKLRTKIAEVESDGPRSAPTSDPMPEHVGDEILQRQVTDLNDKLADLEDEFSHVSLRLCTATLCGRQGLATPRAGRRRFHIRGLGCF